MRAAKITFYSLIISSSFILCERVIYPAVDAITHNSTVVLACWRSLIWRLTRDMCRVSSFARYVYAIWRYFFFHGPHGGRAGYGGRRGRSAREESPYLRARPDEANVAFLLKGVGSQFALLAYLRGLGTATLRPGVGGGSTVQNDLMNGIFHSGSLIIPGTYFLPSAIYFRN